LRLAFRPPPSAKNVRLAWLPNMDSHFIDRNGYSEDIQPDTPCSEAPA